MRSYTYNPMILSKHQSKALRYFALEPDARNTDEALSFRNWFNWQRTVPALRRRGLIVESRDPAHVRFGVWPYVLNDAGRAALRLTEKESA